MRKGKGLGILLCGCGNMVFMGDVEKKGGLCDKEGRCKGYFLECWKERLGKCLMSFWSWKEVLGGGVGGGLLGF